MEIWKLFLIPRLPKWPLGRGSHVCLRCSAILLTYHQLQWKLDHLHNKLWGGSRELPHSLHLRALTRLGQNPF